MEVVAAAQWGAQLEKSKTFTQHQLDVASAELQMHSEMLVALGGESTQNQIVLECRAHCDDRIARLMPRIEQINEQLQVIESHRSTNLTPGQIEVAETVCAIGDERAMQLLIENTIDYTAVKTAYEDAMAALDDPNNEVKSLILATAINNARVMVE